MGDPRTLWLSKKRWLKFSQGKRSSTPQFRMCAASFSAEFITIFSILEFLDERESCFEAFCKRTWCFCAVFGPPRGRITNLPLGPPGNFDPKAQPCF